MASNFTPDKIKRLIAQSKSATIIKKGQSIDLDKNLDGNSVLATTASRLLEIYFSKHPEDSIENYIDETA